MRPFYERDGVTLYHGDSREVLADLPTACANLLLTDPPYGMAYKSSTGAEIRGDARWAGIRLFRAALLQLDRLLADPAHAYVFCHWESLPEFYDAIAPFWRLKNALVWSKASHGPGDCKGDYGHDHELVLFAHHGRRLLNGGRDSAILNFPRVPNSRRRHPTHKPVELLRYLIEKSTAPGETVLDIYAGSGSTLEAAAVSGRRAVGIELDERHCESAARALDAALDAVGAGDIVPVLG
jgi:site-specific DNA-methyltransferase (adenine-specific)